MKIRVKAKPQASEEKVKKIGKNSYEVWVKEPPVRGLANMAIEAVLVRHFNLTRSKIRLVSGFSSRNKIFEIG